ncbi:MAG: ATP12 family protein [Pseudomonadota bacterium]
MSEWKARRFWKDARVVPVEAGFAVELDGRPVRAPSKTMLAMPSAPLAEAVAAEWDAQEEVILPLTMPLTRAVNTSIDKSIPSRADIVRHLAEYGGSDLLSYRADGPAGLVAQQAATWDPVLDWLATTHGARLAVTTGVMPAAQPETALRALHNRLDAVDPWELTALSEFVTMTGSLALGLCALEGHLTPATAWDASRVDEDWQIAQWGEDEEEAERVAHKKTEFLQAAHYLDLLRAA